MATGNAEAIDLICRRYSVGSPSEYLRRTAAVADIALDYAIARHYRDKEVRAAMQGMADDLRQMPADADIGSAQLVAAQWLVLLTSCR